MAEIGLFPLDLVLVPTERVPLHIFEPRYKELIGECLEKRGEFGLVRTKADGGTQEIGTRARVAEVLQVLPDGRMHVVVEGRSRFRLLDVGHERSFDTGTVEDVVDDDDPADPADVERVVETFARVQRVVGVPGEPPSPSSPRFDFEIVARVDFSNDRKQELLELTSPRKRMARLATLLAHALEALELDHELRRRAHGNGRVAPLDA